MTAQQFKIIIQAEKRLWIHVGLPPMATLLMNDDCPKSARIFAGVQLSAPHGTALKTPS